MVTHGTYPYLQLRYQLVIWILNLAENATYLRY